MTAVDHIPARLSDRVASACVRAAAAAPSVHNTQPWLFRFTGGSIDVFVDPSRQLAVIDPTCREMLVSAGAAVFNLRVTLGAMGYGTAVRRRPDPHDPYLVARVMVITRGRPSRAARAFAAAIPVRRTNRWPFADRPVPDATLDELQTAAAEEGARLVEVGPKMRDGVLTLTRMADTRMRSNPAYLRELATWTRRWSVGRDDGLPMNVHGPQPSDARLPLRDLGVGVRQPARRVTFESDPTLLVVFTRDDTPAQWLRAGEALERVWLTATTRGLAMTPMSQLTEIPVLRDRLTDSASRMVPQTVLRIGYPLSPAPAAPRRPLTDVVLW